MKRLLTILFLGLSLCAFGQKVAIKGTVVGGANESPLPGVHVIEKGTTNAVAADANG